MFAEDSPEWSLDLSDRGPCEECGEGPAVIHILRVEGGGVSHVQLCQACAENLTAHTEGTALVLAVPTALSRPAPSRPLQEATQPSARPPENPEDRVCTLCGTTLSDFHESGLVGCSLCYRTFSEQISALVEQKGEVPVHLGKVPRRSSEGDVRRYEVVRLERMLRELVDHERFEEAAGVRDRLSDLTRGVDGGSS